MMNSQTRWHQSQREKTFLRFLTRLSDMMDIPRREVCLPMAWHFWSNRRWDAHTAFKFLAS